MKKKNDIVPRKKWTSNVSVGIFNLHVCVSLIGRYTQACVPSSHQPRAERGGSSDCDRLGIPGGEG